jgi:hypothetical protein
MENIFGSDEEISEPLPGNEENFDDANDIINSIKID